MDNRKISIDQWVDVKGYEGIYVINISGKVKSLTRYVGNRFKNSKSLVKEKFLNISVNGGYPRVALHKKGVTVWRRLHRLLAISFIPNPENKPQVNHKDGNKLNYKLSNLEWCTSKENVIHAHVNKLTNVPKGEQHYKCTLSDDVVKKIRREYIYRLVTEKMLSIKYNVSRSHIHNILSNHRR